MTNANHTSRAAQCAVLAPTVALLAGCVVARPEPSPAAPQPARTTMASCIETFHRALAALPFVSATPPDSTAAVSAAYASAMAAAVDEYHRCIADVNTP